MWRVIRTVSPLGPGFAGASLASGDGPAVGEPVILSGFGATREGDWKSGGDLRSVALAVREPASTVLVWAADPDGGLAGACSGDSGAPIWSADGEAAVAHCDLGAGAPWPRLRRPHARPAARAAEGVDQGDGAAVGGQRPWVALTAANAAWVE